MKAHRNVTPRQEVLAERKLFEAVAALRTVEECRAFFRDLCTLAELENAVTAGDLVGLTDTAGAMVTSFWAIDSSQPALQQCEDDVAGGSGLNWEYATAHTASRGQRADLDNAAGTLGGLQSGVQCNIAGKSAVGCCR